MIRVADLGDGLSQGTLSFWLEYNVEVDSVVSRWVAQSLPVGWNVMPGVLYLHVLPRHDGRREIGEGHCGDEEEHKEPGVWHEYRR